MIAIYKITNRINNMVYVGSTLDVENRFKIHIRSLKNKKHHCKRLQEDYNNLGIESFVFQVVEEVTKELLMIKEQELINYYNLENLLYNSTFKAFHKGTDSDETKIRKSIAMINNKNGLGKKPSEKSLLRLAEYNKNRIIKDSTRQKMSEAKKGKESLKKLPVLQYDKEDNFVKEWKSATDASKALNIIRNNIVKCLKNQRNFAGNFVWKYKISCV